MCLPRCKSLDTVLNQRLSFHFVPLEHIQKQGQSVRFKSGNRDMVADLTELPVVWVLWPRAHGSFESLAFDVYEAGVFEKFAENWAEIKSIAELYSGFLEGDMEGFNWGAISGSVFGKSGGKVGFYELDVSSWDEVTVKLSVSILSRNLENGEEAQTYSYACLMRFGQSFTEPMRVRPWI